MMPSSQHHPFGVRAGKTQQMPPVPQRCVQRQGAQYLGFLAAHDIGSTQPILAVHAGNYLNPAGAQRNAAADDLLG